MSETIPGISKILKSLNSNPRREILRVLTFFKHPMSFTEVMKEIEQKTASSSQLSYHISVLIDANLIIKTADGKYQLSPLGTRSGLLLEMSQEDETSATFSRLYMAFSNLTPRDCLVAVSILPLVLIIVIFSIEFGLLFALLPFLSAIGIVVYLYKRLHSCLALFFLTSFLWTFFVPGTSYLLVLIILSLMLLIPIFPGSLLSNGSTTTEFENFILFTDPYRYIIVVVIVVMIVMVSVHYYRKYTNVSVK